MNTGSFGAPIGGAELIKAAMQARGMGSPVTAQVSPTSPSFNHQAATIPSGAQKPQEPQDRIIVQALIKQLERIDKGNQMGIRSF